MSALLVMPNSWAIWSVAGAIMDEDTGEMNVNADTIAVAAHFFFSDQLQAYQSLTENEVRKTLETHFLGFSGSSGPSQSTTSTSCFSSVEGDC